MTKSTITREQLLEIIETDHVQCGEASYLARMALAAMDSEPVAWRRFQETPTDGGYWILYDYKPNCSGVEPLYRHAQPAPVVPKEMTAGIAVKHWEGGRGSIESFVAGYNFCRAAMLQASPVCTCPSGDGSLRWPCPVHPGNSPVIPDGYVMVPKEPTKEMINAGWLYYMGTKNPSSKGTYKAMLAAAPQEVK
ncbi:hypothetical protein [Klebsiella pneumoniae]|uniref:hypothetical protein n=1 Tax=Klebsiella pneumoniae TaxID=573 RepID=UPI0007D70ED1|nr:hypothetical protein [Klebsiella pneumoniae]SBN30540.1 Eaa protein [Klebsiella pneumoniae]SYJ97403.1 Uncharacterised protein [Klebsiella pneumoniae]